MSKNTYLDVVGFKNILDVDFSYKWDGVPYTIGAGEVDYKPRFLADHAIKHIVDYYIIHVLDNIKSLNNETVREEVENKVFLGVKEVAPEKETRTRQVDIATAKRQELIKLAREAKIDNPIALKNIELRQLLLSKKEE